MDWDKWIVRYPAPIVDAKPIDARPFASQIEAENVCDKTEILEERAFQVVNHLGLFYVVAVL